MTYIFFAILGLLPSLIWLTFYLRKDRHPEPKNKVVQVFLWGSLMGPLAILLQLLVRWACQPTFIWSDFLALLGQRDRQFFLNIILFAPLIEEYLKYVVVKWRVLKDSSFDEPLDAMLYLIISALGFAAVENLLSLFFHADLTLKAAMAQSMARFLSATFLHTLASGILGFFLALALLNFKKRRRILAEGFLLAVLFHSLYNYLAWLTDFNKTFTLAMALLLLFMAGLVSWQFRFLKKQLSICKIR